MQVVNLTVNFLFLDDTVGVDVRILRNEIDNVVHFLFTPQTQNFSIFSASGPASATADVQGNIVKMSLPQQNLKLHRLFSMYMKRYIRQYLQQESSLTDEPN
jgi:uncharacterized protein with WD repeat